MSCLGACARPVPQPPPFELDCPSDNPKTCWESEVKDGSCLRGLLAEAEPDRRTPRPALDRELKQALDLYDGGDFERALPGIRKYAAQGLAEASGRLGVLGLLGAAPDIGAVQAMDLIRHAAGQGLGDFMFLLAELAAQPGSVFDISDRTFCLLARAASYRDPWAMFYLGILYEYSLKDLERGLVWYWRAATFGHSRAAAAIAALYEEGRGLPRDEAQALAWYLVAAHNRLPSPEKANAWYIDNIDVGVDRAVPPALARLYLHGEGIPRDVPKAAFWAARTQMEGQRSIDGLLPEIQAALAPGEWERIRAEAWNWQPAPTPLIKPRLAERLFNQQARVAEPAK
jgi:TPR repeat protein